MIDYRITVDLILSAVRNHVGEDGMQSKYLFSIDPDTPDWKKKLSTTIFFSLKGMTVAALYVPRSRATLFAGFVY